MSIPARFAFFTIALAIGACADDPASSTPDVVSADTAHPETHESDSALDTISNDAESDSESDVDSDSADAADTSDVESTAAEATATIVFPPPSATTANTILVRGSASAATPITSLTIANQPATTNDGYLHWTALVPLALGDNPFPIALTTASGTTNFDTHPGVTRFSDEAGLTRGSGAFPGRALGLAWDAASYRVLASDDVGDGLYAIDPATGLRTVVSNSESSDGPGTGFAIVRPTVLAADGPTAWVADPPLLIAIDLASGDRTIAPGPELGDIAGVALDPAHPGELLVLTSSTLVRLGTTNGDLETLASGDIGTGPPLADCVSLAVDDAGRFAYVLRVYQDVVIKVDLATGARSQVLAEGAAPRFDDPHHLVWSDGALFVWNVDQLVRIAPTTGAKTSLANADGLPLLSPYGFTASPLGLVAIDYVPEWETGPERAPILFAIDPVIGTRVVLAR